MVLTLNESTKRFFDGMEREYGLKPLDLIGQYIVGTLLRQTVVFGRPPKWDGKPVEIRWNYGEMRFEPSKEHDVVIFLHDSGEGTYRADGYLDREGQILCRGEWLGKGDLIPLDDLRSTLILKTGGKA